jgi:hypothetical protein
MRTSLFAAVCAIALGLSGCATVIDETAGTTTTVGVTTTTLPFGPADELLVRMRERISGLSEIVAATGGDAALARFAEIEQLWAAARAEVVAERPELVKDFDRVVELSRRAAERRRPADADKAFVFLEPLLTAYGVI